MFRRFSTDRRCALMRGVAAAWLACTAATALARPIPEIADPLAAGPAPAARIAQRGSVTLSQATAMALQRYQGRVVRAETVTEGGRTVHEIRILGKDGRVRTFRIDAQTGAFL